MTQSDLESLYEEYKADPSFRHLRRPNINFVPGVGARRPAAMIVGEAPGFTENLREVPFCGPSGRLLVEWMELAGLGEENSFITNVLKYQPELNRTPDATEVQHSLPYLQEEFRLLRRPRLIIAVGSVAKAAIYASRTDLPRGSVSNLAGKVFPLNRRTSLVIMFHPSFALRQPKGSRILKRIEGHWKELGESGLL